MPAHRIDGKELARQERERIAARVSALREMGAAVTLDAVLVDSGDNAARVYAENQGKACDELGIEYRLHELPSETPALQIEGLVRALSADPGVTAIMVHMPLPEGVDADSVKAVIAPAKDIEGVNPANIGNVIYGRSSLIPCTALAALTLIDAAGAELRGQRAVVVGAGATVGRPLAAVLMSREATVVSCNRWTWGIDELCRTADILIAAVGKPELVTADMVKPGAVVIDVGINRVRCEDGKTRTVGDVVYSSVAEVAGAISPVPGGVGPMTVAMLMRNVVTAAERSIDPQAGSEPPVQSPRGTGVGEGKS